MQLVLLSATFLIGLSACGGDDDDGGADASPSPVCGDDVCNGNETTASCPADCPAGVTCGDNVCNGSENNATCPDDCPCAPQPNDSCTGENVCVDGSCVSAFGRNYQIIIYDGMMTTTDELGETWDAVGGLPDPYVVLTLNSTPLGMSSAVQDTLTPLWNQFVNSVIPAGSTILIEVYDEDISVDDLMFSCSGPLTADYLRAGGAQCAGTGPLASAFVNILFVRQ